MKSDRLQRHKKWSKRTEPLFSKNPVLSLGLCLPFVIVPSMTLKNGVVLSILMLVSSLIPAWIYALIGDKILRPAKVIISSLLSTGLVTLFYYFTGEKLAQFYVTAGVYVMLLGVNGLTAYCEYECEGKKAGETLWFTFKECIGYSFVVCLISFLRELLALQTVWGHPVNLLSIKINGIAFPFFGFIMLGFLSAVFKNFDNRAERKAKKMQSVQNKKVREEI